MPKYRVYPAIAPDGDPTIADPYAVTFSWIAFPISDRTDLAPSGGIDLTLKLCNMRVPKCYYENKALFELWKKNN